MTEVPLFPLWATLLLTFWAAAGPLAGILIGHYLSRSWQREQWVLDNKKQEYREVLSQLTLTFSVVAKFVNKSSASAAEIDKFSDAQNDSMRILHDRIFIADEIKLHDLQKRWITALGNFERSKDKSAFSKTFGEISGVLLKCALEDMKL